MKNKHSPFRGTIKDGISLEHLELEELLKPTQGELEYAAKKRDESQNNRKEHSRNGKKRT